MNLKMLDASSCRFEGNVCCGERSFSTYECAKNIIEKDNLAVFVEEALVLPVRHEDFILWKH